MTDRLHHAFEILLGLPQNFLSQQGDWSLQFNPAWPGQAFIGAGVWNVVLAIFCLLLVVFVYTNDGRGRIVRIVLGTMRGLLIALILLLLNRPILTLSQSRTEPSVLAIMLDDSSSMRVPDTGRKASPLSRLAAVQSLFSSNDAAILKELAKKHQLRLYRFDRDASPLAQVLSSGLNPAQSADTSPAISAIDDLAPDGQSTQVLPSILKVMQDLQGQRVAGVVVVTDGRDTPARNIAQGLAALKDFGEKVYPVCVGSDASPKNLELLNLELDDVAFKGDVVNVKALLRGSGFEPNHPVHLALKDKKTNAILPRKDGQPAELTVNLADDKSMEVELQWQTSDVGNKDVVVEVTRQPGELDDGDNSRSATVSVLDAKIAVLFVDGYPRWDYRYLKTALIRDKTVDVSCLLASADFNFLQEGNKPLPSSGKNVAGHFPDTLDQLMEYDVIVLGDVDPRYFSDNQLQLMNEFVNRGGGFEMVAGERFAPQAYRNTPIEPLLPVTLSGVVPTDPTVAITMGYRPMVTRTGDTTGIFRFFADRAKNDEFLKRQLPEMFWYCPGVTAKPSVGEVLAEHPTALGPDGHRAPLLVAGRFGGRTLFSAYDESWRWRFYTDEPAFESYWVQQLRYLARNRKIGQRRLTLTTDQPIYELGGQVRLLLRVIDPGLVRQLPDQLRVELRDAKGSPVRVETLLRQDGSGGETYSGSFPADKVGKYTVHLPPIASGVDMIESPLEVMMPRLELSDPRIDRVQLSRIASETLGKPIELGDAEKELNAIPSAAKVLPIVTGQPLWDAPVTMAIFAALITIEWVVRKMYGMV